MFNGVKVNIRGYKEGTAAYDQVLDRHLGAVQQFLNAQQQQVQLSGNQQYTTRLRLDGATAVYSNNNGQEYLDIQVTPVDPTGGEPPEFDSDAYWPWAIIELVIPPIASSLADCAAFLNPKDKKKIGAAHDGYFVIDPVRPPLAYPGDDVATYIADVDDNNQISSLRVDLRPYPGGVKLDLYGYIRRYVDSYIPGPVTLPVVYAASRAANGRFPSGFIVSNGGTGSHIDWPDPAQLGAPYTNRYRNRTLAEVQTDFPELLGYTLTFGSLDSIYTADPVIHNTSDSYCGATVVWGANPMPTGFNTAAIIAAAGGLFTETTTLSPDGITYKVRGIGAMDYHSANTDGTGAKIALGGAGPTQAQGNYGISCYDYTHYFVGTHPSVPHYTYPAQDAVVNFAVMDDAPDGYTNRINPSVYSTRWERLKKYDKRWKFTAFKDKARVPSYDPPTDTSIGNHFGLRKIGTISINPKKGKGGIKFVAA